MKRKLKKLTALLLSILMATSSVTGQLSVALAAEEGSSTPAAQATSGPLDYADPTNTGLPGLYVDFLGDNNKYTASGQTASLNNLVAPGADANDTNGWAGYSESDVVSGTIFWVGVGIDKMTELHLLEQSDDGIYSLELGFYYNSQYIEPYTGAAPADYAATIKAANIDHYGHSWGAAYEILQAETDLEPQTDVITQETLGYPSMDNILNNTNSNGVSDDTLKWKMTYISLEKLPGSGADSRFKGRTSQGTERQYLLLIPFRLKSYDFGEELCLRLARNASHLSIGGGADGAEPYAAWERVTTRNDDRELKLMTTFMGDLNIWTGEKQRDPSRTATLDVQNGNADTNRTGTLRITDDPSPTPASITLPGDPAAPTAIVGLTGGVGMTIDVDMPPTGYTVSVWVELLDDDGTTTATVPVTTVIPKEKYTFLMPDDDVIVHVRFDLENVNAYYVHLEEKRDGEDPPDGTVLGNDTQINITLPDPVTVTKSSPLVDGYPSGLAEVGSTVTIDVALHPDYEAEVWLKNREVASGNMLPAAPLPDGATLDIGQGVITMTKPGQLKLASMPRGNVIVHVEYWPAEKHRVELEVWHEPLTPDQLPAPKSNVAQLVTLAYKNNGDAIPSYSRVVYNDYRIDADTGLINIQGWEMEPDIDFRILEKVDASAATQSGSLGGDGTRTARSWNGDAQSLMALAYSAATSTAADPAADLHALLTPYDLKTTPVVVSTETGTKTETGLRKNALGEFYTDSDLIDFCTKLYALAQLAKTTDVDGNGVSDYEKTIYDTDGITPLYTYYDLTSAQVQAYLLDDSALLDDANAIAVLRAWEETHTDDNSLTTRPGREVALVLEADSAYEVKSIVLEDDSGAVQPVTFTKDSNYANVYTFEMPDYDCKVKVTYGLRNTHGLKLTITGHNNMVNNKVELTAYVPDSPSTAARAATLTSDGGTLSAVLVGSTVSVKVNKAAGYIVSAAVRLTANGYTVNTIPSDTSDLMDGAVFTFKMPVSGDVEVVISYRENLPSNKATLKLTGETIGSAGAWKDNGGSAEKAGVTMGTPLTGEIVVAPGHYIHSVKAYGASGDYSYVLSGNGWNNGLGAGAVVGGVIVDGITVDVVMPGEDLIVEVEIREGPPPEEPELPLSIRVVDPDNAAAIAKGEASANNWAQLTYGTTTTTTTLGPVGLGTPGGVTFDSDYATAGQEITVEFHPDTGYYVKNVEVLPASLGAAVIWTSPTTATFTMPAGSAGVVVEFAQGTNLAPLFLTVGKTVDGVQDAKNSATSGDNYSSNRLSWFSSQIMESLLTDGRYTILDRELPATLPPAAESTGAATPGDTVTMEVVVGAGYYIHSLTVEAGGVRYPYDLTGNGGTDDNGYNGGAGGTVVASFIMANSDMSVTVHYRQGPPPDDPTHRDYQLSLVVRDPDNVYDGTIDWAAADNHASATVTGAVTTPPLGPVGVLQPKGMSDLTFAYPGDLVTIDFTAAPGFALDIILVTPSGLHITPTYLDADTAQFVMPAEDVTAQVRFKEGTANEYTADLVLRMPDGTLLSDYDAIGQGTFDLDGAGNVHTLLNRLYSRTATPGEQVDMTLLAQDGYYISKVVITPATLGVPVRYTGAFGQQDGSFVMPAANVTVNVYFEQLWPDEVKYGLTLKVHDGDRSGSTANFSSIAGAALSPSDSALVRGGEEKTLLNAAYDDDRVVVALTPVTGYYAETITVTDQKGRVVDWYYVPGGIAFHMNPSHVTVEVTFAEGAPATHDVTLHITRGSGAAGTAELTHHGTTTTVDTDGGLISAVPAGDTLTLTATPDAGSMVTAAYAVDGVGNHILLPITQVTAGGAVDFAMPASHAEVYVVFAADTRQAGDLTGLLVVSGPDGAGQAVMTTATGATTDDVFVGQSGVVFAPRDTQMTVNITVEDGFDLAALRVVDDLGNVAYTWTGAGQRELTFPMPVTGVTVYVDLQKISDRADLTAQVVVNNGGNADNNAWLYQNDDDTLSKLLTGLTPGQPIHLDLEVALDYAIEYIKVVPAKFGIAPSLTASPRVDQTTAFTMPSDDVVIYVKFTTSVRDRKTVTLETIGAADSGGLNQATLHTIRSGTKGPVRPADIPNYVSAQAAYPTTELPAEWATVTYHWAADHSVKSLTVKDAAGNPVPFTQVNIHEITFPMVNSDVTVTIEYQADPNPPKYEAWIHVIDLDTASDTSFGRLTWDGTSTRDVYAIGTDTAVLQVPAGEIVDLDVFADSGTYLKAAYVLYRDGGQMIRLTDLDTFAGPAQASASFQMHPARVDVYVYFTTTQPDPKERSAVLMLDSPSEDTQSRATIQNDSVTPALSDSVTANDPDSNHAYVTALGGNDITVTVDPASGYAIASILFTPLGIEWSQGGSLTYTRTGNTIQFKMPDENVAVRVVLKASSDIEYKATLHYYKIDADTMVIQAIDDTKDWASLTFTKADGNTETWKTRDDWRMVPEGTEVTMGVSMDSPARVLAAYVLRDRVLVRMDRALEGLSEGASQHDDLVTDGEAKFTMPAGDVDVFVWFADNAPDEPWRSAILVVTDDDKKGLVNSGKNSAKINSSVSAITPVKVISGGIPTHHFMWVKEGETVTVKEFQKAAGYELELPITISHSVSSAVVSQTEVTTPQREFSYVVGAFNSAVSVNYLGGADLNQNDLEVIIVDPDNPGNGAVTNSAYVTTGAHPDLTLNSTSSAGAWQIIPGVTEGTVIDFTVTSVTLPPYSAYVPVAVLETDEGIQTLTLTEQTDGSYVGQIPSMPAQAATLRITFVTNEDRLYDATLDLVNQGDGDSAVMLYAGTTVDTDGGQITGLPAGEELTYAAAGNVVGVVRVDPIHGVLTRPSPAGDFPMPNADTTLRVYFATNPANRFIASVSSVGRPADCDAPTIQNTDDASSTPGWSTLASVNHTIQVTVTVPAGYTVSLAGYTVNPDGTLPSTADVTLSPDSLSADGEAEFTMPANNTHVIVTYRRAHTLTLRLVGNDGADAATATANGTTIDTDGATIFPLDSGASIVYAATPDSGRKVVSARLVYGGASHDVTGLATGNTLTGGSFTMPNADATLVVRFGADTDPADRYIATVVTSGGDGMAANVATGIRNETQSENGASWVYAAEKDQVTAYFTTDPDYVAVVTAQTFGGKPVAVLQQNRGGGAGTATITMPDGADADDVIITITYYRQEDAPTPTAPKLQLRLWGHDQEPLNSATLNGGAVTLSATVGSGDPDPYLTGATTAQQGDKLYLSANRSNDYIIERVTIYVDGVETEVNRNEYSTNSSSTNSTSVLYMPDDDAIVTVYYRRRFKTTLYAWDKYGADYIGDTATAPATAVPHITMEVAPPTTSTLTFLPTTKTHDPIAGLYGDEEVVTTIDLATRPPGTEISSVFAITASGAVHLTETAGTPGEYRYAMSVDGTATVPARAAEDVDILVILQDETVDDRYTATVYRQGHDNQPGNTAAIHNETTAGLLTGANWVEALPSDQIRVDVTTATGYYAEVTAVKVGTQDPVPVIQWAAQGTVADPAQTQFYMPDPGADVDVTVKYIKGDPPLKELTLKLMDADGEAANRGSVYDVDLDAVIMPLDLKGNDASLSASAQVANGTDLRVWTAHGAQHYVKSITLTVNGIVLDLTPTMTNGMADTVMPFNDATLTVTFAEGQQTGRPYDPKHVPCADPGVQDGWLLGDNLGGGKAKVTIPTLYQYDTASSAYGLVDAYPNVEFFFYLRDDATGNDTLLEEGTDYDYILTDVTAGNYYTDAVTGTAYQGQSFTLNEVTGGALDGKLDGGLTLWVSAVCTDTTAYPRWVEGEKTQLVIPSAFPAPYDPDNDATGKLEKGYIYGENWAEYAFITVPTLRDAAGTLHSTNTYKGLQVTFHFFIYDKGADTYTELVQDDGTSSVTPDMKLEPYDPTLVTTGDPYNYYDYSYTDAATTTTSTYRGAKFIMTPVAGGANTAALTDILNNDGSLDAAGETILYIRAQTTDGHGEYTQVLIKPYYTLTGAFRSYAPTHEATASLYLLKDDATGTADPADYDQTAPFAQDLVAEEAGTGLWIQEFAFKSSELEGKTFMLTLEKPSHITYTRVNIDMNAGLTATDVYDGDTLTFTLWEEIRLIPGDVRANQRVNLLDQSLLESYLNGPHRHLWTRDDATGAGWAQSVYNPATDAYLCDLDGNGRIAIADWTIQMNYMSWTENRYLKSGALPNGWDLPVTVTQQGSGGSGEWSIQMTPAEPEVEFDPETPFEPASTPEPEPEPTVAPEPAAPSE